MVSIIGDVSDVRRAFDEVDKSTGALGKSMTSLGNDMSNMGKSMSLYVTAPLVAMGAGAFAVAMDFDDAMRQVQAVTGETGTKFTELREAALQMGADTAFSSSQAADAMLQLGQAGFTADEIMISTADVLSLASAGALDLGTAAGITANAMNGFGMSAGDTAQIVDVLAKGASISTTSVEGLGNGLSYVAPVAHAMGMSLEETVSILASLSNAGIEGERAGTALRGAISRLAAPSNEAAKALANYGLSLEDVNPATHTFTQILDTLSAAGITSADVMQIFGQEAGPGVLALLGQGTGAIKEQTLALQNSKDAAQQMAETMEGGVGGAWRQFTGSVETLAIVLGDLVAKGLTPVIEFLTRLFNVISGLPEPVMLVVVAVGALAAAIGPVLTVAGILISSVGAITTALGAAGLGGALTTVVGILTGPVAIAIAAFAAAAYIVYQNWDTVGPLLERVGNQVQDVFTGIMDFVDPAIDKITEFVDGALTSLSEWWEVNGEAITQAATTMGQKLMEVFETMGGVILFFVSGPMIMLYESFRVALDIIIPLLEYLGRQFGETIMLIVNLINGDFSAAWENIKNIVQNSIDFIVQLITEVLPTAFSDVWDDILSLASIALDLLIQLITGKTGEAATELKEGIVNAGAGMVDGMLGWVPGVSGVVDGMRDELLRVPDEANTAMSQFGPVVTGHIDATAIQAAAAAGTLVTETVNKIEYLPGDAATAMNPFSPAIVNPINATVGPASSAASNVGTGATNSLSSSMKTMGSNTTSVMNGVAASIRDSGSSLASAATSAGSAAVSALNIQLAKVQYTSAQIKAAAASGQLFASSSGSSSSGGNMPSSGHGGSSSSTGSTGIKRQGSDGTGEDKVKIREAHATGGIAGYTGWHWMEEKELAVPEKFDWDGVLTSSLSKALKSVASSGVSNSYAGDTVINVNATLTPQYNFEALMRDIERELSKNKTRRGILS